MKIKNLQTLLLTVCVMLAFTMSAYAQTKTVSATPTPQTKAPSTNLTFDVMYNSTDNTTTGIGFKMCFDPTQVAFVSTTNQFPTGLVAIDAAPTLDGTDADGNAATTQCIGAAWSDPITGNWPNTALPQLLFTANFTTTAGFTGTTIGFGTTSCGAGFTCSYVPEVVNAPVPPTVTLSPDPLSVAAGTTAAMTATISAAQGTDTVVTLSSSTGAATVPASVTILAGQLSANFNVTGVTSGGSAVITATLPGGLGGDTDTATVNVTAATITLNCPDTVSAGGSVQCTLQVTPGQVTNVTITDGANTTASPLTVTTTAGGAGSFTLTGDTVGGPDTITATLPGALGGASATDTVTVQALTLSIAPASTATAVVGSTITYTVCLSTAQATPTVVTIPADPDFAFSATSVTISANTLCAPTFTARPVATAAAPVSFTVTAPGGLTATAVVNAVTGITCTLTNNGTSATLTVTQAQPGDITIGTTSSATGVLTVPATVTLAAGNTSVSIPYTVLSAGTSTITATLPAAVGGTTCNVAAVVNPTPIPTVGGLGLALLAGLLALAGAFFVRK